MENRELANKIVGRICSDLSILPLPKRWKVLVDKVEEELNAVEQQRAADGAKSCPECGEGVVNYLGRCEICGHNPPRR